MNKSYRNATTASVTVLLSLATLWPAITMAQGSGSTGLSITVERSPYLSFVEIPESLAFKATATAGSSRHVFNSPDGPLSVGKLLAVQDTRNSGGFIVQAQGTDFSSGSNTISAGNLRIVSSSMLSNPPESIITGHIHYYGNYSGTPDNPSTMTVSAPVNAIGTDFSLAATFDEVQNRPQNNALNNPVDIMSGCLSATQGRIGTMGVGLTFDFLIPPFAPPGLYSSTITYTIIDFTEDYCP